MNNRVVIVKDNIVVWSAVFPKDIISQGLKAGLQSNPEVIEVDPLTDIQLGWIYDGSEFKIGQ